MIPSCFVAALLVTLHGVNGFYAPLQYTPCRCTDVQFPKIQGFGGEPRRLDRIHAQRRGNEGCQHDGMVVIGQEEAQRAQVGRCQPARNIEANEGPAMRTDSDLLGLIATGGALMAAACMVSLPTAAVASEVQAALPLSSIVIAQEPDIEGIVSELKGSQGPDNILNALIKINDVTDSDLSGTVEDPIAKEYITNAIIAKKQSARETGEWREDLDFASGILRRRLDPYSITVLRPYLNIAPFIGGFLYLATFVVQQKKPEWFAVAYISAVATLVLPGLALVVFS